MDQADDHAASSSKYDVLAAMGKGIRKAFAYFASPAIENVRMFNEAKAGGPVNLIDPDIVKHANDVAQRKPSPPKP